MIRPLRFGSPAVSAVVLASMLAGCAAPQQATNFGGKLDPNIGLATRALAALNSNNLTAAVSFAEQAVAKTPNDAGYRALLGNAYFMSGRFASAESAYKDALTIYSNQPKVILKLALVETALGKKDEAVAFLHAGRSVLDPSDYGLALALAGRPDDALEVLEPAARQQGADAQVRQNLALAYALAGNWAQARTVAAQDVPANQLDARIQQWMQLAAPKRPADQVATLLGVTPAALDRGEPVRLALAKSDSLLAAASPAPIAAPTAAPAAVTAQPQVARLAPAMPKPALQQVPQPKFVEVVVAPSVTPEPTPAIAPAPKHEAPAPVVAEAAAPQPVPIAMMAAAAADAPSAFLAFMPHKAAPAARPKPRKVAAARPPLHRGDSVVQLGAYRSPAYVSAAWDQLTRRYPALRAYLPLRARFDSPKGTFYRLSIQGFSSEREAIARCELLKSRGGNCFVRNFAGDVPVRFASN